MVHQSEDKRITIWAKTWSEVLHANRHRLQLFQQKLEYNADHDKSLQFLRETYQEILHPSEASRAVPEAEVAV